MTRSFKDWEAEQMKDPEFRAALEELEISYQIARPRMLQGISLEMLASQAGIKLPRIAGIEAGNIDPHVSEIRNIAHALGARMVVRLV